MPAFSVSMSVSRPMKILRVLCTVICMAEAAGAADTVGGDGVIAIPAIVPEPGVGGSRS